MAVYSPRKSRRDLKDIEYLAFCRKEIKEEIKDGRWEKWRTRCKCIRFKYIRWRSQRGKSVQKVSLRQRQVITHTHEGGIQGGGELPDRDLRLGRHLLEWP